MCLNCFRDVDEVVRMSQMNVGLVCDGSEVKKVEVKHDVNGNYDLVEGSSTSYHVSDHDVCGKRKWKFKQLEDEMNINNMSKKKFAPQSKRKITWAVNKYQEWRRNRLMTPGTSSEVVNANLELINQFSKYDLAYSLARFIHEVRKMDGSEYPPNTVREIIIMIQMYLHECNVFWKLLDQPEFMGLCNVVDNMMKERHAMGLGVWQSSDIISLKHEDELFRKGILGDESPMQLLRTVVYMIGLHCALRGGVEHNNLRRPGCHSQLCVEFDTRGKECLVYHEDPLQKTNQGGLVCKNKSKTVFVYCATNRTQYPVQLFKKYVRLMPEKKRVVKSYT